MNRSAKPRGAGHRIPALMVVGLWLAAGAAVAQAQEVFDIDTVHSAVNFKVRHLFSYTSGQFTEFGGTLWYDAQRPENSRIELTIQAASIDTRNEKRDGHLRSADFLEAETYPQITFKSTKIEATSTPDQYLVTGDFTLHGVTQSVAVEVEILGFGENPGFGYRGGFNASAKIDRKAFGVVWNKALDKGGTLLGDDVLVDASLEVIRRANDEDSARMTR